MSTTAKSSTSRSKKDETSNTDLNCASIGNYVFVKTLGEGNFAKVKLAKHKLTAAEVAIKIIDKTTLDEKKLGKLYREVRIMKMLNHPHIVKLYEVIETKTTMFLVMEYSSGGELYDYLVVHGKMKEKEARAKFRQILSAVSYCHKKKVIHRDLKAENLLLDHNLDIKIADFGFSNLFDPDSKLDTFCGSPPYAAPELFQGRRYTGPEVDIWSLGVILYVLTTGCLPFDGKNLQDMRESVCKGKYRIPFYLSDGCEKLLRKMLTRDPAKRASLDVFVDDAWINDSFDHSPISKDVGLKIEEDESIIRLIEVKYHVERNSILQSLRDGVYDDISAIYYLIYCDKATRGRLESDSPTTMTPVLSTDGIQAPKSPVSTNAMDGIEEDAVGALPQSKSSATSAPAKPVSRRRFTVGNDSEVQKFAEEDEEAARLLAQVQINSQIPQVSSPIPIAHHSTKIENNSVQKASPSQVVEKIDVDLSIGKAHEPVLSIKNAEKSLEPSKSTPSPPHKPVVSSISARGDARPTTRVDPKHEQKHQESRLDHKHETKKELRHDSKQETKTSDASSDNSTSTMENSSRKRHNTIVGILRNTLYRPTDANPTSPTMTSISPSTEKGGDTVGVGNTQASFASVNDADAFEPVKPGEEGKPRSLRFTFSSNTTSSKPADEIVREVMNVCSKNSVSIKLASRYLVECQFTGGKENPDETLKFEIEICRLPRLKNLHGLRFKRTSGSSNDYKEICEKLVSLLQL